MPAIVRIILTGFAILASQWLVLGRLSLWGAYPDAVLLFVAWLALRQGRRAGAVSGFLCGLVLDAIYDTWGLHMLVKTVMGFAIGLFPAAEREGILILPRQAFVGSLVIALVHNGILVMMLALQTGVRDTFLVSGLWLGSALYTAVMGTLYTIVRGR